MSPFTDFLEVRPRGLRLANVCKAEGKADTINQLDSKLMCYSYSVLTAKAVRDRPLTTVEARDRPLTAITEEAKQTQSSCLK